MLLPAAFVTPIAEFFDRWDPPGPATIPNGGIVSERSAIRKEFDEDRRQKSRCSAPQHQHTDAPFT